MSLLCKIFGHDTRPSTYMDWELEGINFWCIRCKKGFERFEDIK